MFVDIVKISLSAGNGGDGAVSFHREKYVAAGGPDGGDGGRGGSIYFKANDNLSTLMDFRYKRKYSAANGENGRGNRCSGKSAEDIVINVPRGTVVKDTDSGRIVADISGDEPVLIVKGGAGGKGNMNFATPTRQVPRFAKPGVPGEKLNATLELKLLADVGLAGFPNVGKSSLISVVSAAKPAIANYPFTTVTPVLGMVSVGERSFVMADIPGLIEGASDGAGLGHTFLRHVERCRLIIHVVDVSGSEGRDPIEDFEKINLELSNFSPEFADKPQIVAANKADIASDEQIRKFTEYIAKKGLKCFVISAATSKGTRELAEYAARELDKLPPIVRFEPQPIPLSEIESKKNSFTIERLDDGSFHVEGEFLLPILRGINMDDYESLQYLQRVLNFSGINDELIRRGVRDGDTVSLYDLEFEYVN